MVKRFYNGFFLLSIMAIGFALAVPVVSFGQLYTNTFTGASACPTNGNVPTNGLYATGTPFTRTTVTCMNTGNVFNSTTLNNTASVNDNSYIEFSVTADASHQLLLTSLSFFRQASNSAPNQLEVRYSTDGFATSTSWGAAPVSSPSGTVITWDFADFSTPIGGTVTFRFYPYGTQRADGLTTGAKADGTFRVDDVTLNGEAPLPVNLVSFAGKSSNKSITLNWVTNWENKNLGFDIQRSTNALNFEGIGFVAGTNSTESLSVYEFTDTDVTPEQLYYYRLKQKDIDGGVELSRIIAVRAIAGEAATPLAIFPNPNKGNFTLSGDELNVSTIILYTAAGVNIPINVSQTASSKAYSISAKSAVAPGIYYLKTSAADGTHPTTLKVVIY